LSLTALAMLLGYVNVYARVTVAGYSRGRLDSVVRAEKIRNERLKLTYNSLCSPARVVAAAEKSGMVYPSNYEYLRDTRMVASAR